MWTRRHHCSSCSSPWLAVCVKVLRKGHRKPVQGRGQPGASPGVQMVPNNTESANAVSQHSASHLHGAM